MILNSGDMDGQQADSRNDIDGPVAPIGAGRFFGQGIAPSRGGIDCNTTHAMIA